MLKSIIFCIYFFFYFYIQVVSKLLFYFIYSFDKNNCVFNVFIKTYLPYRVRIVVTNLGKHSTNGQVDLLKSHTVANRIVMT